MSQGYAIELYFDPALENQILKAWNVLARRQISTHLIEIESRPHITLFSSSSLLIDPTKLETLIRVISSKQEPFPLSFSVVGSLSGDNSVLFLAVTPTVGLLQFQGMLCEDLKNEGVEIGDEYRGDCWFPYCAVAVDVPKGRMGEGFSLLREFNLPVNGYGIDIGLVEFSPVREVFSFVLGDNVET